MSGRGALFGNASAGPGSTGGSKHLIEMRAGKMTLKGHTVYPDKRKGLLYVYQSEDSLMHFSWQDRTTGVVEDDLIIFPEDCEYVKVPQCTTGRVYLLKFKSSNRRFFFWLQEPRTDKDDDHCKRINEYLNNPGGLQSNNADQDLQSLLNNMSQTQLMQLLGGGQMGGLSSLLGTMSRPSTGGSARTSNATTPSLTHRTAASTPATQTPTSATAAASATTTPQSAPIPSATPAAPKKDQSVDFSTALTSDALSSIMSNQEALEQLQNHLPTTDGTPQEQLKSTLQSPQFQQAVSQFSNALESGQLGPVVSQLVANPEVIAAANEGNIQEFVKALEKSEVDKEKPAGKDGKDKKDKEDDEGMQLD
ncbi:proteasomal ubiquitin receptor ADRM1-like isoform X3 [Atheta coriaria]|uniref:proteasomal ubiquitin receptor ADRM1-like isoform X3 n=1 Tax=Dalotia coriaria TaxID=877792 RepID=UPI0031F43E0F